MPNRSYTEDSRTRHLFRIGVISIAVILISWAIFPTTLTLLGYNLAENRGVFGDQYGSLNALFSGLALAAFLITLLTQQHELRLQRQELELTRRELQGQKVQLEAQNRTLGRQVNDNFFIHLLEFRNRVIENLIDHKNPATMRGVPVLTKYDGYFSLKYHAKLKEQGTKDISITQFYESPWNSFEPHLKPYFGTTEAILEFIRGQDAVTQSRYLKVFELQLAEHEKRLLLYHAAFIATNDRSSLLPRLLAELPLLENIDRTKLYHPKHFEEFQRWISIAART